MDQPSVYTKTLKLRNADVDQYRRLRPSVLFGMLQEAAIAHTEALGMGREKTLDRGLLWIVALQQVSIRRMPVYDETVTLYSWPGKTMHLFFPRYFRMTDAAGEVLLEGSAPSSFRKNTRLRSPASSPAGRRPCPIRPGRSRRPARPGSPSPTAASTSTAT